MVFKHVIIKTIKNIILYGCRQRELISFKRRKKMKRGLIIDW